MMFLSWGGPTLEDLSSLDGFGTNPVRKLIQSLERLHAMGVAHADVRRANILCPKPGRLMLVDFERAVLFTPRPALA
jgi:RIO-like serine/threonine protein kinase